jgi:twinkle protein
MSVVPPMTTGVKYFANIGQVPAIGFIYGSKEQPDAIKWRALDRKAFMQEGTASDFYGLAQLDPKDDVITVVEGECEVVALANIGIKAISVPNGAPIKVSHGRTSPEEDVKFAYLWEARDLLGSAKKIVLAVDADGPGDALAEEIARRTGREKCWRTHYPDDCNDLTDVIAKHGKDAALLALKESEALPLVGIYGAKSYAKELFDVYRDGNGRGESTGYAAVDELFTIKAGDFSVVTGLPGSGKSEFTDQLMMNLAKSKHWKFAVASFENKPSVHIAKLAEKYTGLPFYEGQNPRMSHVQLQEALEFIDKHFVFLELKDGNLPTIESIISRTKQACLRLGVRGLLIDPYNYIVQDKNEKEHTAISEMLTKITVFAKAYGIHIWFVAHPTKIYPREDGSYPVPKGNHISGGAAWFAKSDIGVTVDRSSEGVKIHCWKMRNKWIGKIGQCVLGYDIPTGRYFEQEPLQKVEWASGKKLPF